MLGFSQGDDGHVACQGVFAHGLRAPSILLLRRLFLVRDKVILVQLLYGITLDIRFCGVRINVSQSAFLSSLSGGILPPSFAGGLTRLASSGRSWLGTNSSMRGLLLLRLGLGNRTIVCHVAGFATSKTQTVGTTALKFSLVQLWSARVISLQGVSPSMFHSAPGCLWSSSSTKIILNRGLGLQSHMPGRGALLAFRAAHITL